MYIPRNQEWKNSILDKLEKRKYGYELYIIQAKCEGNPIKVGISGCPQIRMEQLQIGCPFKLELVGTAKNADRSYEIQIHKKLSEFKLHGEWFKKEALEDLAKIAQIDFIQNTNSAEEVTKKYNMLPVSPETELSAKIYIEKVDVSSKNVDSDSNKGAAVDVLTSIGIYNFLKEENEI